MSNEKDLESQVEAGGLFTHSALSRHAERINRIEAFLYGLADVLLDGGQVTEEQLRIHAARVAEELRQKGETLSGGVLLRLSKALRLDGIFIPSATFAVAPQFRGRRFDHPPLSKRKGRGAYPVPLVVSS